jgi:(p)ppGpp synthase/HD superfamily hydrolase
VRSCSDTVVNSSAGQKKEDWKTRKTRYIEHLNLVDQDTLIVSLSDKVHNARSILRDLRKPEIGNAIWKRFKPSKEDTLWYYRELARSFQRRLKGQSAKMQLADELSEIVDVLERT